MNHLKILYKIANEKDKIKYLKKNGLAMYEVICSFFNQEQVIIDLIVNNENEQNIIFQIFDALNEDEIRDLAKISLMRLYTSKIKELPKYIQKNNGKYYEDDLFKFKKEYFK